MEGKEEKEWCKFEAGFRIEVELHQLAQHLACVCSVLAIQQYNDMTCAAVEKNMWRQHSFRYIARYYVDTV